MEELVQRFRWLADQRSGLRYSLELRELAVECVAAAGGGTSVGQVAAQLGVGAATLQRWLAAAPAAAGRGWHEVVVRELDTRRGVVVVAPSGWRVEGLSVAEAAELLAAVG